MQTKTLWIRDDYLQQILDGRKTVEVRVAYANIGDCANDVLSSIPPSA